MLAWIGCALPSGIALLLGIKLWLMKKDLDRLGRDWEEHCAGESNTLLSTASRDRTVRLLAVRLNGQLAGLRRQRRRYQNGDRELKEAITNASHDLRTPLTAICGYLALLEGEEMSAGARRYFSCVEKQAKSMKRLTQELFSYSTVLSDTAKPNLEPVELKRALEESLAVVYPAFTRRGLTPDIRMPEGTVWCMANPEGLSRVLDNLMSNAQKYSDGDLQICLEDDGRIVFSNASSRLDEVQAGRLFDRFYTVENARESTGLGLSIAKELTERMGGSIAARYADGRLYVTLLFPRISPPLTAAEG